MRMKPRGSRCSSQRRRNSSDGRLMTRVLFLWAESRQRKLTWKGRPVCCWRCRRDGCKRKLLLTRSSFVVIDDMKSRITIDGQFAEGLST